MKEVVEMRQILPASYLSGYPCSVVAVACALGHLPNGVPEYLQKLKTDGYATLNTANRFIRDNLSIRKRIDYRRGQRPILRDLHLDGKAVVCVYGHLIYLDRETYHSFFQNENDDVVAVWIMQE